jgi:iron complex outermembrane receptor protein
LAIQINGLHAELRRPEKTLWQLEMTQCSREWTVHHRLTAHRFRTAAIHLALGASLGVVAPSEVFGQSSGRQSNAVDLTELSIEDLMAIRVTSVSKKEQTLAKTGAAVFVITQEDIHNSGATNIPDVLRMAPGVDVAQIDANRWAISIRGFNSIYANKVLVLIDGRSVYSDSFSGVFWDQQNVPLEDIGRIEVIRGPGGTVWGANAVNGVINIITKDSRNTHGGLISAGGGTQTAADSLVQYGGAAGPNGSYRVSGRYFDIDDSVTPGGQPATDGWHGSHGGFRTDWDLSRRDTLSVQGDLTRTAGGENVYGVFPNIPLATNLNEPVTNSLGDIVARWEHTLANGSQTSLQVYYDYVHRSGDEGINQYYRTADVEFQHHLSIGARHDIVWGLDYRMDDTALLGATAYSYQFDPNHRLDNLAAVFLQDEIAITKSVFLTVGSKFEHNDYTGFQYEPSAQLMWTPSARQTLWASASRAIREPAMFETAAKFNIGLYPLGGGNFGIATLNGDPHPQSEKLRDFEIGYRNRIGKRLSVDLTGFLSYYRNLETFEPQDPFFSADSTLAHLVIPEVLAFNANGRAYGGEIFVNWDASSRLRISSGYSLLNSLTTPDASAAGSTVFEPSADSPRHQVQVRGHLRLRRSLEWDASAARTSSLANVPSYNVPGYTRIDSRLGWRAGESLEFSVVGQNLASRRHLEFADTLGINGTLVLRSVFAKVQWRF